MKILGISGFYHDSAAALTVDGVVKAAAQQERFSRKKHDASFPATAIAFCLNQAKTRARDLDAVVFYEKPFNKFERIFETFLAEVPHGFGQFRQAFQILIREKLFLKTTLIQELSRIDAAVDWRRKLLFSEHHLSHAASAFFPSPFADAAVLTLDGVGEWATSTVGAGHGRELTLMKMMRFPHSLGLLYSTMTAYCGFRVNSGEYKLMGLAPYGRAIYVDKIMNHLIHLEADGSFRLDLRYFGFCRGDTMFNSAFCDLFGGPPRKSETLLEQHHMDLAASIQAVLELVLLRLTRTISHETGLENLCLAGGVALNCVANGKVLRDGKFKRIWVQPAAGDAGGAIGAALAIHHGHFQQSRSNSPGDQMSGAFLGPEFTAAEIEQSLRTSGAVFQKLESDELIRTVAHDLDAGLAVGWHQGRMEFGPRALGARSILADARNPLMQRQLNLKIKFRESFRPFAPAVRSEDAKEWFDLDTDSPYMMFVGNVLAKHLHPSSLDQSSLHGLELLNVSRSRIPAVTHIDCSARIQTVHHETHPRFHALLTEFKRLTGCPIIVNTSFNVRGEPIVCTPQDAYSCFMGTGIDRLAIGDFYLRKEDQLTRPNDQFKDQFHAD